MRPFQTVTVCLLVVAAVTGIGCSDGKSPARPSDIDVTIDPAEFIAGVNNPLWPLTPGTTYIYEGVIDGETERNIVEVLGQTRDVMGVTCVVVRDRVWAGEDLIERTFDWYAQHQNGDVWYFGEASEEIEDGEVVSTDGSWEGGVDDAVPGIVMKTDLVVGDIYRQEYYEGEAEDMAEILSLSESVVVPFGSFSNCLETKEYTPLEPGVEEHKYYAAGIGFVLEVVVRGGSGRLELVDVVEPMPVPDPADFTDVVDNPFFPLVPGTTFTYEGESDGESERIVVEVLRETKTILGVACVVVRDRVFVDDELVEDTHDWYAQHVETGDVWYFGEDVKDYEDGVLVGSEGAWEAGVDGAQPGILIENDPQVGDVYRQEFYAGVAEDAAEVLGLAEAVSVPYGDFGGCMKTKEYSPLAPDAVDHKFYAPGVGFVMEVKVGGGEERVDLVTIEAN